MEEGSAHHKIALSTLIGRKYSIKFSTIVTVAFYLNALIILGNLNGLVTAFLGVIAPLSPILLINSIILISVLMFVVDVRGRFHSSAMVFLSFLTIHIIVGLSSGLFFYDLYHPQTSVSSGLRQILPTYIIFYSSYLYFNLRAQQGKTGEVLVRLTWISFITVLLIIFGEEAGLSAELVGNKDAGRSAGLFANPNGAGVAANISLVLAFACMLSNKKGFLLYMIIAVCSMYASFITFSKAAILMTAVIILAYPFYMLLFVGKISFVQRIKLLSIIGGFVLVLGIAVSRIEDIFGELSYGQIERLENVAALVSGEVNENTTSHRSVLWKEAFEDIKRNPIIGYGLESFHRLRRTGLGVHNTYLMLWGEAGILSIGFFLFFLFSILFNALFLRSNVSRVLTTVLIYVFMFQDALTGHNTLESRMAAIVLALCCSLVYNKGQSID